MQLLFDAAAQHPDASGRTVAAVAQWADLVALGADCGQAPAVLGLALFEVAAGMQQRLGQQAGGGGCGTKAWTA